MHNILLIIAAIFIGLPGCQPKRLIMMRQQPQIQVIDSTLGTSPEIDQYLIPFRQQMAEQMNRVIGKTARELTKTEPQGLLGNFVTDALLAYGRAKIDSTIDFALVTNGGMRVPLPQGAITRGKIYELMPFDNELVVLTLRPGQLDSVLLYIAIRKGVPFAGMEVIIENDSAIIQQIAGKPRDKQKKYKMITSDYLALGGDKMTFLQHPVYTLHTNISFRDMLIAWFEQLQAANQAADAELDNRLIIKQ